MVLLLLAFVYLIRRRGHINSYLCVGMILRALASSSKISPLTSWFSCFCINIQITKCFKYINPIQRAGTDQRVCAGRTTNCSIQMEYREAYFLNDSLYWLAIKDNTKGKILRFNVKTEVSKIINLPKELVLVGGCDELALITGERNNKIFIWTYNFVRRKWKIHRIWGSSVIPDRSLIDPWILPLFYDENQNRLILYKMCSSGGAYIEEIMGNSTENIVCISVFLISSYYWRIVKHYF